MTVFLFEYKLKCSTIFMFNINMQSLLKLYFYSAIVQETKLLKTDSRAMCIPLWISRCTHASVIILGNCLQQCRG